ncbi:MAG TPA: FtsX-like permease family protein, partial [Bryobacteraceae bacterium]|nr:FtsX-like permease family protein [Bryobacteraceae bacterium]
MTNSFWRTATKIAWRETRASRTKFMFVVISVAIGVGALTGVRGFSESLSGLLSREARTLLGGDIAVRMAALPSSEQLKAVGDLESQGVRTTWVTETLTMASTSADGEAVPVMVKAIDPSVYPFYGTYKFDRPAPLNKLLRDDTAVVSEDLRVRLNLQPGQKLRIGGVDFRVAAFLLSEPDRLVSGPSVGPRVLITRGGLGRTELIQLGSRAPQRILLRVPDDKAVDRLRASLRKTFESERVTDYREVNQNVTKALDDTRNFLSLISLIALIVGAIGVATAMHAHLQQKMDSIAVMKSIGGRTSQIVQIYLLQTLTLGLIGGVLGIIVGSLLQRAFPILLGRLLQVSPEMPWLPSSAAQGLLAGLLTTLLFTLPPLLSVRRIKPALVLRRDMEDVRVTWRTRLASSGPAILSAIFVLLGMSAIAIWLMGGIRPETLRIGRYFVGGLAGSLLVLSIVAMVLLRALRIVVRLWGTRLPASVRHGISNLYRPGSQTTPILTSLGIGVMFTLTVYLVQSSLLREIRRNSPPGMANVFLLDINEEQRGPLAEMLKKQPGVEGTPELIGTVSARVASVDGVKVEDIKPAERARVLVSRRIVTWSEQPPAGIHIRSGEWWKPGDTEPSVAVHEFMAKRANVKVGSTLEWNAFGKSISTRVAAIYYSDPQRLRSRFEFVLSPGLVTDVPVVYYGAARVNPQKVAALQRVAYEKFPTVTVLNMADIITRIQEV